MTFTDRFVEFLKTFNDFERVSMMISRYDEYFSKFDWMWLAGMANNVDLANYLVEHHYAELNTGWGGWGGFLVGNTSENYFKTVEELLSRFRFPPDIYKMALESSFKTGNIKLMTLLFSYINLQNYDLFQFFTELLYQAAAHNIKSVKWVLEMQQKSNTTINRIYGLTSAAYNCNLETMNYLIKIGTHEQLSLGGIPVVLSSATCLEVLKVLLESFDYSSRELRQKQSDIRMGIEMQHRPNLFKLEFMVDFLQAHIDNDKEKIRLYNALIAKRTLERNTKHFSHRKDRQKLNRIREVFERRYKHRPDFMPIIEAFLHRKQ